MIYTCSFWKFHILWSRRDGSESSCPLESVVLDLTAQDQRWIFDEKSDGATVF